jgi:PIN domain nuclease of toxin-antitoxin system
LIHTPFFGLSPETNNFRKKKSKILDINEPCYISIASFWEITIKKQIGKLELDISIDDLYKYAKRNQIEIIQITSAHLIQLESLAQHHNDPFDRLIVSQAIAEKMTLYSRDKGLKKYKIKQEWG